MEKWHWAVLEPRQVFEASDFDPELTPELRDQQESLREQSGGKRIISLYVDFVVAGSMY